MSRVRSRAEFWYHVASALYDANLSASWGIRIAYHQLLDVIAKLERGEKVDATELQKITETLEEVARILIETLERVEKGEV